MAFGRPLQIDGRQFAAFDPEPPPRRWYERAARFAAVVAIAGVVAAGAVFVVRVIGHSRRPAAPVGLVTGMASPVGRVALLSADGSVALSDVDGTHLTALRSLRHYPDQLLALSIDGRYLIASNSTIIAVQGSARLVPWVPFQEQIFEPAHFTGAASTIPLGGGKAVWLGIADAAAGDPQQIGAFVSVPCGGSPPVTVNSPPFTRAVRAT